MCSSELKFFLEDAEKCFNGRDYYMDEEWAPEPGSPFEIEVVPGSCQGESEVLIRNAGRYGQSSIDLHPLVCLAREGWSGLDYETEMAGGRIQIRIR